MSSSVVRSISVLGVSSHNYVSLHLQLMCHISCNNSANKVGSYLVHLKCWMFGIELAHHIVHCQNIHGYLIENMYKACLSPFRVFFNEYEHKNRG